MSQKKADIEFGHRAWDEVQRLFKNPRQAAARLGITRSIIYDWRDGHSLTMLSLEKLYYAGADIKYILTGRKSNTDNPNRDSEQTTQKGLTQQ